MYTHFLAAGVSIRVETAVLSQTLRSELVLTPPGGRNRSARLGVAQRLAFSPQITEQIPLLLTGANPHSRIPKLDSASFETAPNPRDSS